MIPLAVGVNRVTFGLIGLGRIGGRVAGRLAGNPSGPRLTAVLVRPDHARAAAAACGSGIVCTNLVDFIACRPDVVVECASREALWAYAVPVLATGVDLMPLSLAALADPEFEAHVMAAVHVGPGRLEVPAGAMGGLDILAAAREEQLSCVVFRAAYPTARWRGTAAETMASLDHISERTTFYRSSVRDIARLFPRHVNVAVGVALAGRGLDDTEAELVADPRLTQAEFEVDITAGPGAVKVRVHGRAAPLGADPIDYSTFSILRLLRRRQTRIMI